MEDTATEDTARENNGRLSSFSACDCLSACYYVGPTQPLLLTSRLSEAMTGKGELAWQIQTFFLYSESKVKS